jgi:5-methylthioribose kinase
LAHVADLDEIADADKRALCESRALHAARELLLHHRRHRSVSDVIDTARAARARVSL